MDESGGLGSWRALLLSRLQTPASGKRQANVSHMSHICSCPVQSLTASHRQALISSPEFSPSLATQRFSVTRTRHGWSRQCPLPQAAEGLHSPGETVQRLRCCHAWGSLGFEPQHSQERPPSPKLEAAPEHCKVSPKNSKNIPMG